MYRIERLRDYCFRSIALTLFVVSFLSYSYFFQGGGQNEAARFDVIRSVLDEGRLIIDSYTSNSADVIVLSGHVYSGKAPGTFYLGLIPYAATRGILRNFPIDPDVIDHWSCYVTTILAVSLPAALCLVLVYWFGLRLSVKRRDCAAVALTLGFATIFFPFATVFFSHVSAAFCLWLGFYQLFAHRQEILECECNSVELPQTVWRLWLGGIAIGFSITLEYPSAIAATWLLLYGLWMIRRVPLRKHYLSLLFGTAIGLAPLLIYNQLAFHNPFYVTYEAYAHSATTQFTAHQKGILGIRIPFLDPSAWPQFMANLGEITFKPLRGLFFANPVLLIVFVGFLNLARRARVDRVAVRSESWVCFLMFISYFALNASFGDSITYWGGGASFGPRYLIVMLPFLSLPLFKALQLDRVRAVFTPLALISAFQCLMATAIEPRTPYSPANPIYYFYLPRYLTSALATNTIGIFSTTPMTDNSVAFNFGKLWGFPQSVQLILLFLIWLAAAKRLDRQLMLSSRGFLYAIGIFVFIAAGMQIAALSFL